MASDADPIRGIALAGNREFFPVRGAEGLKGQCAPQRDAETSPRAVRPGDFSDEALVAMVRAKNEEALDWLFTRHSRLVYGIALRILRDSGEAEEVVQEAFLYVFRKAFTFEPARGSAKAWIVQVAYSRARDRKAHLMRRGFYLQTELDAGELEGALAEPEDPERVIDARLDIGRLESAFEELSDIQQKTLRLFYFEDLDLREVSERLQQPLGNVRHYFYRGLERLRKSAIVERLRDHHDGK